MGLNRRTHCKQFLRTDPFKLRETTISTFFPTADLATSTEHNSTGSLSLSGTKLRSQTASLLLIVVTALTIRLVLALFTFHSVATPTLDHNEFGWEMGWTARSIALGHGFGSPFLPWTGPTALVPPLYPCLLALVFHLLGLYTAESALVILILNSIFSALTCLPIFFAAKHSLGERIARLAAWGWVFYPYAIYFSGGIVWDYALTALLFCTCFWAAQRLHLHAGPIAWIGFGALFGLTALSNPSVVVTLPFLLLIAVFKVRQFGGRWLRNGLLTLLTFAAVLAPWTVRNYRAMHAVFPVRDGFWLEFWAGNNGDTFESNSAWAHPASNPIEMQKFQVAGEIAYLAQKRTLALDFIKHHPLFFAEASLRRVIRFWTGFWSFNRDYLRKEPLDVPNLFLCTALTILSFRGLSRWWRADRVTALRYLVLIAFFPVTYYLTHSSMDYRQPIEPEIVILATIGMFGLNNHSRSLTPSAEEARERELVGA